MLQLLARLTRLTLAPAQLTISEVRLSAEGGSREERGGRAGDLKYIQLFGNLVKSRKNYLKRSVSFSSSSFSDGGGDVGRAPVVAALGTAFLFFSSTNLW